MGVRSKHSLFRQQRKTSNVSWIGSARFMEIRWDKKRNEVPFCHHGSRAII
ncbi:2-octaprenyl-6-methoxyphenyl hydroxylase [Sesbania bispinosa]|nr:2-octaprenyl-6-methoxyphenyl hydroxylase [Sesbania bispinosa]